MKVKSICKFVPVKKYTGNIKTVNFVFETKFKKLKQPFYYPINYIFLVTSGTGILKMNGCNFPLSRGNLFFSFPQYFHEIDASDDFTYVYISFMGESVQGIFKELGITPEKPVYGGFDHLIEFWMNAIGRFTHNNSNLLTESVLLYTLSIMGEQEDAVNFNKTTENKFELIVYYIDNHYAENDISLKKIADIFNYTPKYLSYIFKKNMNVGFTEYINSLRIQHACSLIEGNISSISEIALSCGYSDPLYFSKVFKNKTGFSPQTYIKRRELETTVKGDVN